MAGNCILGSCLMHLIPCRRLLRVRVVSGKNASVLSRGEMIRPICLWSTMLNRLTQPCLMLIFWSILQLWMRIK